MENVALVMFKSFAQRTMAGQLAARERGVHCGRPRALSSDAELRIVTQYTGGGYTLDGLADVYQVHPSVIKRAVYRKTKPGHSSLQ